MWNDGAWSPNNDPSLDVMLYQEMTNDWWHNINMPDGISILELPIDRLEEDKNHYQRNTKE
jgi:hypothetical protein